MAGILGQPAIPGWCAAWQKAPVTNGTSLPGQVLVTGKLLRSARSQQPNKRSKIGRTTSGIRPPMNILVFNCGSSSLNYKVFSSAGHGLQVVCRGKAHRVGVQGSEPAFIELFLPGGHTDRHVQPIPDHRTAANLSLNAIAEMGIQ